MKRSKILTVILIGVLLAVAVVLAMAGCGPGGKLCVCGHEDKGLDKDKDSLDILCWNIFCQHKWDKKKECPCE